jgi:DNA replication protein DnaC
MEQIKSRLTQLKLSGMTTCLKTLEETRKISELSLYDGLHLLLQAEYDQRLQNRYQRLLKNASFRYQASIAEITVNPGRGIDETKLTLLAMGEYIKNGECILITGASGSGKRFLASAFGSQACKQGYTVLYFNMQKLLMRLKVARLDGSIIKMLDKIAKTELLIPDDFGLTSFQGQTQLDFLEIIEDRHAKRATIIASQLPVASWFNLFQFISGRNCCRLRSRSARTHIQQV